MYKLINSLTVNNRLRVISILIVTFSLACVLLLWNTSHSYDRDVKEINYLTDLEFRVWQIRNNYNSMRGDIMQVFIADPITQQEYVKGASALMQERIDQIKESAAGIQKDRLDEATLAIYGHFDAALQSYIQFSIDNLPAIQVVHLDDSVEFNRIRNLLVVDLNDRFLVLREQAIKLITALQSHKDEVMLAMDQSRRNSLWFTLLLSGSLLTITLLIILAISKSIIAPIQETEQILQRLSSGELPEIKEYAGKDEFSRMLRSLRLFNTHIHYLMDFVRNVAQNNFAVQAQMFEGQGPIAASLVSMRNNLQVAYAAESQRTWASQGMAELGELLRRQQDSGALYDNVLSFIVKYLSANQGVLYISDEQKTSLDLVAAYAYGRRKHLKSSVTPGEGLAGQVFLEKNMMLLKEIPDSYIKITSGLGEALPRVLVISPLVTNDEVYGILEIASFKDFDQHVIEFIKKISEELAVIVKTTRVNVRTQELLRESQQQAEEMKAQEEEMRQNVEELQATQEGMGRMLKEVQQKEKTFVETLDAIQAPVMVFDRHYKVLQINKNMKRSYAALGVNVEAGTDLSTLPVKNILIMKQHYDRALQGEVFHQAHLSAGSDTMIDHYSSIRNGEGVVTSGVVIAYETDARKYEGMMRLVV
ncbi:HAMP domain-containing protein [Chryseolinea serpens]|uniref:HAMP domain-containing protein n=1 Tax=Chryseolinea serpens TaxID=947013 RepID=A0A1M5URR5_9BACT|nr:GAF domain-containing protein [Chryseolinea serpens]SHH65590.1 HAMP domain-containing protein [Chryseolinea serpens]